MHIPWFHNRRHQLLAEPFPDPWLTVLGENVRQYDTLNREEQEKLRGIAHVIIAEKNWEGCGGLTMTDEVRVTVAAQAALLLLALDHDYFHNVESILVYPGAYFAVDRRAVAGMVVQETVVGRLGEASTNGPVILSWPDVRAGGRNASDGHNVVLHEFAHKLDFRDGSGDGVPRLHSPEDYERWSSVMSVEYNALVAASAHGHAELLDRYGATNPAEFFAVCTECFFERAANMRYSHSELYAVLRDFYRQDPASRSPVTRP
ncbi:MAG: zinc-dependent peptidase [Capsulimonadaceae bacterium]